MRIGDKLLSGQHSKVAKRIIKARDQILDNCFIAIDPASKDMGYAVWQGGEFVTSGEFVVRGPIGERLQKLYAELNDLPPPMVLAIEQVGGGMRSHKFLLWSCGIAAGATGANLVIEIPVMMWKKWCPKNYQKGNEEDALTIGKCVMDIAQNGE